MIKSPQNRSSSSGFSIKNSFMYLLSSCILHYVHYPSHTPWVRHSIKNISYTVDLQIMKFLIQNFLPCSIPTLPLAKTFPFTELRGGTKVYLNDGVNHYENTPSVVDEHIVTEQCSVDSGKGKLKYLEQYLVQCHFVHNRPYTRWTGIEPTTFW